MATSTVHDEPLPADEQRSLCAAYQGGDRAAGERLLRTSGRFIAHIIKRSGVRASGNVPYEDLMQIGGMGLLTAMSKFDAGRGVNFTTYAYFWVRQALQRGDADSAGLVRPPVWVVEGERKLRGVRSRWLQVHGSFPTVAEMAAEMGCSEAKIREFMDGRVRGVTWQGDLPMGDGGVTFMDTATDDGDSPEQACIKAETGRIIDDALDRYLTVREANVIRYRFGLHGGEPLLLSDIGKKLSLTRERVRQLEAQALKKLRHPRLWRVLSELMTDDVT